MGFSVEVAPRLHNGDSRPAELELRVYWGGSRRWWRREVKVKVTLRLTGLSFAYAAGSSQRGLFRVLVPWDLWPYFTVSHLRLSFSSPPTTRRVMVEVFRLTISKSKSKSHCHWRSVSQPVSKSWCRAPSGAHDQIVIITAWQLRSYFCENPAFGRNREVRSNKLYKSGHHSKPRL
jgi:hypothetical protein